MSTKSEGQHNFEGLISEAPGTTSRDKVTVSVPAGEKYTAMTVLGQNTASGKYRAYDDAASDGHDVAAAVLLTECDNTDGLSLTDFEDAVVIDWSAEVRADALVWGEGVDDDGGLADLAALGIKAR